jgi:protein SCO1/2
VRRRAIALACAALLSGIAPSAAADTQRGSGISAGELTGVGFDQRLGESIPLDAPFQDEAGRPVTLSDYFGKRPVVLALVYNECPMLCSLVLSGLVGSLRAVSTDVGKDFDVLVVSFDPKDTPEISRKKKAIYVERYKRPTGEAGFHFLTGTADSIARLTRAVGFRYEYDQRLAQFAHPSGIVVLTPGGVIARYLFGSEFSPKDLGFSLAEASQGKVGSIATKLLLLCYAYDPKSGTYSASAIGAVRIGGAATLLALSAFVGSSLLRERRRRLGELRGYGGAGAGGAGAKRPQRGTPSGAPPSQKAGVTS